MSSARLGSGPGWLGWLGLVVCLGLVGWLGLEGSLGFLYEREIDDPARQPPPSRVDL